MRESVIDHKPGHVFVILRSDYLEITGHPVAAQILSLFEYWANGVLASLDAKHDLDKVCLGKRMIKKPETGATGNSIEEMLLGSSSERTIRNQIKELESKGFVSTFSGSFSKTIQFTLHVGAINRAIRGLIVPDPPSGKSSDTNGNFSVGTSGNFSVGENSDRSQTGKEDQPNSTSGKFTVSPYIRKDILLKEGNEGEIFEIQEPEGDRTVPVPEELEPAELNPVSCQSEDHQPTETQPDCSAAIDNISQQGLVDPMAARFAPDRRTYHKALRTHEASRSIHKELHGDTCSNDWHPALIKAVQKKLAGCGKPAMPGDACTYLAYRAKPEGVTGSDIDLIVSLYETAMSDQRSSNQAPAANALADQPDTDPETKQAAQNAIEMMRDIAASRGYHPKSA